MHNFDKSYDEMRGDVPKPPSQHQHTLSGSVVKQGKSILLS